MSSINTNVNSINAQRNLAKTSVALSTAMQRLSSGMRVNGAKDDAAGLAIAERMDAQTRGMNVAIRNANDAISLAATAEGALGAISANLQRMRELTVQAANGSNNSTDITALAAEFTSLTDENTRVVAATKFNKTAVIAAASFTFQIGANDQGEDQIIIAGTAPVLTAAVFSSSTTAVATLTALDTAIDNVTTTRSTWGAAQNRFESVIANLRVAAENSAAARGRIVDADYAQETANLTRAQVLQQAGTAMVAQANQGPNGVLALLR